MSGRAGLTCARTRCCCGASCRTSSTNALRYTRRGGVLLGARVRRRHEPHRSLRHRARHHARAARGDLRRVPARGAGGCVDGGFGLGLTIVRRLAQALEHPIDLASRVGLGSTFALWLPASRAADARRRRGAPLPARLGGLVGAQILVIENERRVAAAMRALLERWGCRVNVAGSPGDAREALRRGASVRTSSSPTITSTTAARLRRHRPRAERDRGGDPRLHRHRRPFRRGDRGGGGTGLEILRKPVKPAELRSLMAYLLA